MSFSTELKAISSKITKSVMQNKQAALSSAAYLGALVSPVASIGLTAVASIYKKAHHKEAMDRTTLILADFVKESKMHRDVELHICFNNSLAPWGGACATDTAIYVEKRMADNLNVIEHEMSHITNKDVATFANYEFITLFVPAIIGSFIIASTGAGLIKGYGIITLLSLIAIIAKNFAMKKKEIRADEDSINLIGNFDGFEKSVAAAAAYTSQHPALVYLFSASLPLSMRKDLWERTLAKLS